MKQLSISSKGQLAWQRIAAVAIAVSGALVATLFLCIYPFVTAKAAGPTDAKVTAAIRSTVNHHLQVDRPVIVTKQALTTTLAPGDTIDYLITVENPGDFTDHISLVDHLPQEGRFVVGSLISDNGMYTPTHETKLRQIQWELLIQPHSRWELHYQFHLWDRVDCDGVIDQRLSIQGTIDENQSTRNAPVTITCTTPVMLTDFGDAPDSDSNHHGLPNIAYTDDGTLGHFPTVWEGTPATEASGPTHGIGAVALGSQVDGEQYADLYWPSPKLPTWQNGTNILQNGEQDIADQDLDDSWLNPGVPLLNCEPSMLIVGVTRGEQPIASDTLWLNVWFDGNRDGDWQDSGSCPGEVEANAGEAHEWIVQNYAVDATGLPINEMVALYMPTVSVLNQQPERAAWLRFTLSEQKAVVPISGGTPDGRGPAHPAYFQVGETEDWLMPGIVLDNVQPFEFETTMGDTTDSPVSLAYTNNRAVTAPSVTIGTELNFTHFLALPRDATPAIAEITSQLPAEVTLIGEAEIMPNRIEHMSDPFNNRYNMFTPFAPTVDPTSGLGGTVDWRGQLAGDAHFSITYKARVDQCPPSDQDGQSLLHNRVTIRQSDGTDQHHESTLLVNCESSTQPKRRLFLPVVSR